MGQPAARMGDMTAHGGVIAVGCPTVLIGGQPAARMGDMTTCPMVLPAPAPVPHVGGPIQIGSPTVLIGGQPAAVMGGFALCPPMGPAPIVVGCPTVLIGGGGGGGGGGSGGFGGGGGSATAVSVDTFGPESGQTTASESSSGSGVVGAQAETLSPEGSFRGREETEEKGHWLDVKVTDKGGHPIRGVLYNVSGPGDFSERGRLGGRVSRWGIEPGTYDIELSEITSATWSTTRARIGEEVRFQVTTVGVDSGAYAKLEVFIRDSGHADSPIHLIETSVENNAFDEGWTPQVDEGLLEHQDAILENGGYSNPFYVFKVTIGKLSTYSPLLQLRHDLEVRLIDDQDQPLSDGEVQIFFANGEIRSVPTDNDGKMSIEDVPPGRFKISVDPRK